MPPAASGRATPLEGRPQWHGATGGTKEVEALVSARVKGARGGNKQAAQGSVEAPGSREWFQELGKEQAFAQKDFGYIQQLGPLGRVE